MNRWQRFWKKREMEEQLDRELRFHFDCQVADNIREGMSEAEARRQARLKFGGLEGTKEECRSARGTVWVDATVQDVRFALRTLRKSPAFTVAAIGTLALGIGANTAIFQLLDAVRLRSLPVPDAQQLARIQVKNGNGGWGISSDGYGLTYPLWDEVRNHQQAFSSVFAWDSGELRAGEGAQAQRMRALRVSGEFFPALRLPPAAGRLFSSDDDQRGCTGPGVILSYGLWQSEFAGRTSAVGSRLIVQGHPFTVVGVAPAMFSGLEVGSKFDIAMPLCAEGILQTGRPFDRRDVFWLRVMGRLKPGWTLAQASGHLQSISSGLIEATVPTGYSAKSLETYKKFRLEAVSGENGISWLRAQYDTSLWLLLGITGLVLLIACTNLANLVLARASSRQREYAVRLALGASRGRLIRQSLCESLLLAGMGATLGLALARILSQTILSFLTVEGDPLHLDLSLDWRMLAFTAGAALTACTVFGLAPAFRSSQTEPGVAIKSGGRSMTADRERFSLQRFLVVVQISVSLVLVAGALLFVRSFRNLMTLDLGFRPQGILLAFFDMTHMQLPAGQLNLFERSLLDEIRSVPQVESAATTTNILVGGGSWTLGIRTGSVDGASKFTWVSPGHFKTLRTDILAGRDFNTNDTETSPKVAIVNQTFVRRYLGGADPIGKTFRTAPEPNYPEAQYEIVGVIQDTKYFDLRDEAPPISYAPAAQYPDRRMWSGMYIRSSAPPASLISALKRRLGPSHPEMAMEFRPFQDQIEDGLIPERLMAALSGFFGALAALLATIGLYGLMAYVMVRRRNEIGIRMALGAGRGSVIGLVMKDAALLVMTGIAVGLVCGLALARTAASLLFGLSSYDALTFGGAALLLATVAALGSYLPAHRASRLDPMTALRYE
jgi:putative ABC transport system permease protein